SKICEDSPKKIAMDDRTNPKHRVKRLPAVISLNIAWIPGSAAINSDMESFTIGDTTKYPAITPKKAMEALRRHVVLASATMDSLATTGEVAGERDSSRYSTCNRNGTSQVINMMLKKTTTAVRERNAKHESRSA